MKKQLCLFLQIKKEAKEGVISRGKGRILGGGRGKGRILGGGKDSEAGRVADGCVENISPIRLEGGMCWFGRPECGMNRLINMWALFRNMYTTFLNHKYEILTEKD